MWLLLYGNDNHVKIEYSKLKSSMYIFGYHRVSGIGQHLDRGIIQITEHCKEHKLSLKRIYCDKATGKNFDRAEYMRMKRRVKQGDIIIFTEVDRIGRDREEILRELRYFREKKIIIWILEIPTTLIDPSKYESQMVSLIMEMVNQILIEVFSVVAQWETEKRAKRQREGIEAMKERGEWEKYGRPRKLKQEEFLLLYEKYKGQPEWESSLCEEAKISITTLKRYMKDYKDF